MFDSIKGMAGLAGMMKDLPRIKAKLEEVKERLGSKRVEAETGGGAVRVVANGHLRVVEIHIDPILLSGLACANGETDREIAEELLAGAVNAALAKAREAAEAEFAAAAADLGLPLPAGGLGGLIGGEG
jgi:DNA-binding protein YbaB